MAEFHRPQMEDRKRARPAGQRALRPRRAQADRKKDRAGEAQFSGKTQAVRRLTIRMRQT